MELFSPKNCTNHDCINCKIQSKPTHQRVAEESKEKNARQSAVKKILSNNTGYTLTELLVTVIIMCMFMATTFLLVSISFKVYRENIFINNSEVVSVSIIDSVRSILFNADYIRSDNGTVYFHSPDNGYIFSDETSEFSLGIDTQDGKYVALFSGDNERMIVDKAAYVNLYMTDLAVDYLPDSNSYTIKFTLTDGKLSSNFANKITPFN